MVQKEDAHAASQRLDRELMEIAIAEPRQTTYRATDVSIQVPQGAEGNATRHYAPLVHMPSAVKDAAPEAMLSTCPGAEKKKKKEKQIEKDSK